VACRKGFILLTQRRIRRVAEIVKKAEMENNKAWLSLKENRRESRSAIVQCS